MATVLIFDMIDWRLHETAALISGHRVVTANDPKAALHLLGDPKQEIAAVVADWEQSYGPRLIKRTYETLKTIEQAFILVRDRRPKTRERRIEIYNRSTAFCAAGLVYRSRPKRRFRFELNDTLNDVLMLSWLYRINPYGFPFAATPRSDRYAELYLNSSLSELVAFMGGWEAVREATDWEKLAGADERVNDLFILLQRWADAFDRDHTELMTRVLAALGKARRNPRRLRNRMIGELAEAVPIEKLVSTN